jgi:hypothetical protein
VLIRPATTSDLPELHRIWWATQLATDPKAKTEPNPWFAHVLRTGRMLVAVIDGEPVGFAGRRELGGTTVVTDFFVHPASQGRRVGSRLLADLLTAGQPVMTLASDDPRAQAAYARCGMRSRWECHYLSTDAPVAPSDDLKIETAAAHPLADADVRHLRDDFDCAFLSIGGGGWAAISEHSLETCRVSPAGDPTMLVLGALGEVRPTTEHRIDLQLSDRHPAFAALIDLGFRVDFSDTLMASAGAVEPDPTRFSFNGDILDYRER